MLQNNLALIFLILLTSIDSFGQCPTINDVLNQGYVPGNPFHNPSRGGNMDEFAVVDAMEFMVKVNNYPPVRSFYIPECNGSYYYSFDTDYSEPQKLDNNLRWKNLKFI